MRAEDAVYGGEMSAHHYFREFAYCDSGMLPWLRIVQEMSATGSTLSDMVRAMQADYPASGEINRRLKDPVAAATHSSRCFFVPGPTSTIPWMGRASAKMRCRRSTSIVQLLHRE